VRSPLPSRSAGATRCMSSGSGAARR
jgi:hypothetical protein